MRILICDQDEDYMDQLMTTLESFSCEEDLIFQSFNNVKSAQYRLRFDEFDMAFIDSSIQGESGIALGKKIMEKFPNCFLFFNSSHYDDVHEMFVVRAFQFLIKKNKKMLRENFYRALEVHRQRHLQLPFMTVRLEKHFFVPEEILYVETGKVPSKIVTTHYTYYGEFENMLRLKKTLTDYHFFQVHQSFFVNLEHMVSVHRGELIMDNGDAIPTSTYNKVFVDEAIQRYINDA